MAKVNDKHLNGKIIKAKKNLGLIKYLSKFLQVKTLDQMYKALVRSLLDYCDIIYHTPSKQDLFGGILNSLMAKAERIQYQAALAITGAWKGTNRSKHDELGWESLSDRRWCRRILQVHKTHPVILKTNFLVFGVPCTIKLVLMPFMV